ncbi:hypothetical protein FRC11_011061, partial [Ceratobasidium sp. 423]
MSDVNNPAGGNVAKTAQVVASMESGSNNNTDTITVSGTNDPNGEDNGQKDQYCYICEDGGNMVPENPTGEPQACVSIPESMIKGEDTLFPCPKCVSDRGLSSIGYFVNQGARATMHMSSRTSLAVVIYHLHAMTPFAKSLSEQLHAALSSFYVTVAFQTRLIHRSFVPEDADAMFDEIARGAPYHVAIVFLTEGDPQGGWWHTSQFGNQRNTQVSEDEFLGTCLHSMRRMARGAVTARVFGVSCGFNLQAKGSMEAIVTHLEKTPFLSLVMPSTCSLMMSEYVTMLPEIFVNLYYFGAPLESTLFRVWGKSKEHLEVRKIEYAPRSSRPLGVCLPLLHTICGCLEGADAEWAFKKELQNSPEVIFIYRSRCCGVELQVGIHPNERRQLVYHEVSFIMESWNRAKGKFNFHEARSVRMKILSPHPDGKPHPVDLAGPWTRSGIQAVKHK